MNKGNSTNKELVEDLLQINQTGKYNQLIANAKANRYHDYKNPEDVICGKHEVVKDIDQLNDPNLKEIRDKVIDGYYDETPDEEDKEMMRQDLPEAMWKALGLD